MTHKSPPSLPSWILERMIDSHTRYSAMGDFEERFHGIADEKGRFKACLFFWSQLALLLPAFLKNFFHWSVEMFRNHFKIGFRNITKHKGFSFIHIAGMAVGLALFILIALYIQFELSFDRFHTNLDRIYRVEQILAHESSSEPTAGCPTALSAALEVDIPDFEAVTRFVNWGNPLITTPDNRKLEIEKAFAVDNTFLKMFSFPMILGDINTALEEPFSMVITETTAERVFGSEDPLGQVLRVNNRIDFKVTGVIADIPKNSHIQFNGLISVSSYPAIYGEDVFSRWGDNWVPVYVLLNPGQPFQETNEKIRFLLKKYQGERSRNELYLRPLARIHLHADVRFEFAVVGSIKNLTIFAAISIFVLLIGCINFMNLETARGADRAREVGLRKVVGAQRTSLIKQFLGESLLTVTLAMVLALLLALTLLPEFNQIVNRQLSLGLVNNWLFTLGLVILIIFVSILSGFYPAFVLSSFRPVQVLRGNVSSGARNTLLRKFLVVFQFSISIGLIIGTIIILQQNNYLLNKDLGYNSEQMLVIPAGGTSQSVETLRTELLKNQNIKKAALHDYLPHSSTNWCYITWEGAGPEEYMKMNVNYIDEYFIPAYEMTILEGRAFTTNMRGWKENAVILNESAAQRIGWDAPIGKRLRYNVDYRSRTWGGATVVGIIKDYHFLSLHHTIGPIMLRLLPRDYSGNRLSLKISTQDVPGTLASIEKEYENIFPSRIFEYSFLDENFEQMYLEEQKAGRVILYLAMIGIFIACLGLYGLSSYTTKQRTKEIGIRRVVGASVPNITLHLTRDFVKLVGVANLFAWPAAYYTMHEWLKNFPYRVGVNWLVFIGAGIAALLIALATVGFQSIRAARANPADSLRYE
jgi:putative ABC transport system permease protein